MKPKAKSDIKQAEKFLSELQTNLSSGFQQIAELLTKYQAREASKDEVFSSIVREIKKNPQLLRHFNQFLQPDKRVNIIPLSKIQEMLTFLLEELNKKYSEDSDKFHAFIDFFYVISKERIDLVCFTSYDELVSHTLNEIHSSPDIRSLGGEFTADIERTMDRYLAKVRAEPPVILAEPEEKAPSLPAPPEADGLAALEQQPVTTTVAKKPKQRAPAPQSPEPPSAKAPPPAPQILANNLKQPEVAAEEPVSDNLKVEENVFRALKRKMGASDFQALTKNLSLYMKNIVSYLEFVKLSEKLLMRVEKEICMALKEIVESRERSRTAGNLFNIKLQLQEMPGRAENRSYKRITTSALNSEANEFALINKTYMATAHGNESAVNFEEGIHKKAVKNVSEETLYRVEDEIHEFDSVVHQTQIALSWVKMLGKRNISQEKANVLCHKLKNTRIFNYLYGTKDDQIIEELKNRPPELLQLVERRLGEKLEVLRAARSEFADKNWQFLQSGSYYKALDARANSLKFAEKRFFHNKGFLGLIKETGKNDKTILGDSLSALLGHGGTKEIELPVPGEADLNFWNPVICFFLKDKDIMADIVFFIMTFIKLSKASSTEKDRAQIFIERVICNFLEIETFKGGIEGPLLAKDVFLETIGNFERALYPKKSFFYSNKLALKIDESNYAAANAFLSLNEEIRNSKLAIFDKNKDNLQNGKQLEKIFSKGEKAEFPEQTLGEFVPPREKNPEEKVRPAFQEMIIEFSDPNPSSQNSFYASQQFYLIYQYFILLYERFEYASHVSQASFGNKSLYELFKQIVLMQIFGILDIGQYEDAVRMLFDHQSGVFLNFDKLLHHCVKNLPADDFANFVLALNSPIFSGQPQARKLPEQVLFARTFFKWQEQLSQGSKAAKPSFPVGQAPPQGVQELLKFEVDCGVGLFLVHRVRTVFEAEQKNAAVSANAFVEEVNLMMARPLGERISGRGFGRGRKLVVNNILHFWDWKKREVEFDRSGTEDLVFSFYRSGCADVKKKRISKLKKIKRFNEVRQNVLKIAL